MDFNSIISMMEGTNYINLDSSNIIELRYKTSSKGNQNKYYDIKEKKYIKEQFIYQDVKWKDYMVEHLSYIIGSQLNTSTTILKQDIVKLSNGNYGVISNDFAIDKQWVSMIKLCDSYELKTYKNDPAKLLNLFIDIFKKHNIKQECIEDYFTDMIILDYLLGNEDRHYNNFGLLVNSSMKYEIAPLFDFGLGLFEHDLKYKNHALFTARSLMSGKPFSEDLSDAVDVIINMFGKSYIYSKIKDITVPDKSKFPNDLGYKYFIESLEDLKENLK